MLKFLFKIWPALIPIMIYIFWVFVIEKFFLTKVLKKKTEFDGEKVVGEKSTETKKVKVFSLQNRCFVIIAYMSLILAILVLITMAFSA